MTEHNIPKHSSPTERRQPLPYLQRYVEGTVIRHEPSVLHFAVLAKEGMACPAQRARVQTQHLPEGSNTDDYPEGSEHRLFLLEPTTKDKALWFASLAWADPKHNPWDDASPVRPRLGDEATGTVSGFVGEYAAIVTLDDSGIDAFIHWEQLPKCKSPIASVLHQGDRLLTEIISLDADCQTVHLSVQSAIEKNRQCFVTLREQQRNAPSETDSEAPIKMPGEDTPQPFQGLRVLLVEHDRTFSEHLLSMLEGLGAHCVHATHPQHLEKLLKDNPGFTHVLSDYHMGGSDERREMHQLLRRVKIPVALMSGDYAEAKNKAIDYRWAFLPKPVSFDDLHTWLIEGKAPPPPQDQDALSASWELGVEGKAYLRRAEQVLGGFCGKVQARGAFWARRQRPGVYAVLAAYGLQRSQLQRVEEHFGQTMVHNVIEENAQVCYEVERTGPLSLAAPELSKALVGLPLCRDDATPTDALFVYTAHDDVAPKDRSRTPVLNEAWDNAFTQLSERLADVDELTLLAQRVVEAESFALVGRVSGSMLHEIRQALQAVDTYTALAQDKLAQHAPEQELAEVLKKLRDGSRRVDAIAKGSMYNLQKTRRPTANLGQRLGEILGWYQPRAQRHNLLLQYRLPANPITVFLPPEALEQPLSNLLDNALHHFGSRHWGCITVSVMIEPNNQAMPIIIDVCDQGMGMTAEQCQSLFIPRVSTKGMKGHGLGLYASRQLLRAVGGDLELAESLRWLGSTFRIRLPYQVAEAKER